MKRYGPWIKLALLFCVAIAVISAPPTSLAYIAASSNTVQNAFRVEYLPPQDINVPVRVQKTMISLSERDIGPGGFDFRLINVDTDEAAIMTSLDDGRAEMNLTFTADDVGKTFRYRLHEMDTGRKNVTYDESVYDISIAVNLNEVHELCAEMWVDGVPVKEIAARFENVYYVPVALPDTGDEARPILWAAMLVFSAVGLMILRKKRNGSRRL